MRQSADVVVTRYFDQSVSAIEPVWQIGSAILQIGQCLVAMPRVT
jgi:hypothetical protein